MAGHSFPRYLNPGVENIAIRYVNSCRPLDTIFTPLTDAGMHVLGPWRTTLAFLSAVTNHIQEKYERYW